jgi:predicted TPR repeat methyltransferase
MAALFPEVGAKLGAASAALESGDTQSAEALCRAALAISPRNPDALHLLGIVLYQSERAEEAIAAVEESVALAPDNAEAWLNLGNMLLGRDASRAERCFGKARDLAPGLVPARGNLAGLLVAEKRYAEAIAELTALLESAPGEPAALRLLAKARREMRDFAGAVSAGREALARSPDDAGLRSAIEHTYFLWFDSVDRDPEAALPVLEAWLAFAPNDPVARHMRAAHSGKDVPTRASDAYVERHFDEFAATFDSTLTTLGYRGPEIVRAALERAAPLPKKAFDVVDLGCGTGRAGPLLAPWARSLVGVDLSQKMLDVAATLGVYDALERGEIVAALASKEAAFDVAVVTDTFVYFGALEAVFAAIARALRPGGLLIGTHELLADSDAQATFRISPAGRYAHTRQYVARALEGAGLELVDVEEASTRIEYGEPVAGLVVTAKKPLGG